MNHNIVTGCYSKLRYKTFERAERVAERRGEAAGIKLRPYYCGICQGYHLTKRPPEVVTR